MFGTGTTAWSTCTSRTRRITSPFKIYANDIPPFRVEVAKRIAALNSAAGLPRDWPIPRDERARMRTEVAREFFAAELAGRRRMRANWLPRSPNTPGHRQPRSPATTSPSPP